MKNEGKIFVGKIINVQAYKFNGKLYRQWNGMKVIENSKKRIVCLLYKTKVVESCKDRWTIREPHIWFFPKNYLYNVIILIRNNGLYYYTNIASKPIFESNTIKFIDYDLDVKAYPQRPIKIVDKKEYEINSKKFEYPKKLKNQINNTLYHIIRAIKEKHEMFNNQYIHNLLDALYAKKIIAEKIQFK